MLLILVYSVSAQIPVNVFFIFFNEVKSKLESTMIYMCLFKVETGGLSLRGDWSHYQLLEKKMPNCLLWWKVESKRKGVPQKERACLRPLKEQGAYLT